MRRYHEEEGLRKLIFSDQIPESVEAGMHLLEDPDRLVKVASPIFKMSDEQLRPPKGFVGIHTVALGDWETYGSNRNADTFPKKACITRHQTFVTHGHVFRNHDNRDPEKALGKIAAAAYNEPMGRIELVTHVDEKKAAPELHRLEKEGTHSFSMACLKAGTPVITLTGVKPVESVTHGDVVLTHTGSWKPVRHCSIRTVDQYLRVRLASWGRTDLEITGNHKVRAARFEDIPSRFTVSTTGRRLSQYRRLNRHKLHEFASWVPASELTPLHYMLVPIDREISVDVAIAWARVLGYYVAEGSFSEGVTQFTCHVDDAAVVELPDLAQWTSTTIVPKNNCACAVTVNCYGTGLQRTIDVECGHPGNNKRVPISIQHASIDAKLNFMAAWFNGDGWQDNNGLHWSTHYQALAIDLQRLLASCDIPSSCIRIDHPVDRGIIHSTGGTEYVVRISNEFSCRFCDISKAVPMCIYGRTKCRTFISGDYLCVPVTGVEVTHEKTEVYNFSVSDDESYTAYGLAVSNCKVPYDRCSVCGQLRKSAADPNQCSHVRDNLGRVFADGTCVATHNDIPTWFDESFVNRPADRIAWDLAKVASSEGGAGCTDSVKLAEASGIWVPDDIESESVPGYSRKLDVLRKLAEAEEYYLGLSGSSRRATHRDHYMWELRKAASCSISDEDIAALRKFSPEHVFEKLAQHGIVLDAASFFKYAMGLNYGELADDMPAVLDRTRDCLFSKLYKSGAYQRICRNVYFDVDTQSLMSYGVGHDRELAHLGHEKLAAVGGFVGPSVDQRIIDVTVQGKQINDVVTLVKTAAENPAADRAAEIYAAYKVSAINAILSYHKQADTDQLLALGAVQNLVR